MKLTVTSYKRSPPPTHPSDRFFVPPQTDFRTFLDLKPPRTDKIKWKLMTPWERSRSRWRIVATRYRKLTPLKLTRSPITKLQGKTDVYWQDALVPWYAKDARKMPPFLTATATLEFRMVDTGGDAMGEPHEEVGGWDDDGGGDFGGFDGY